MRLALCEGLVSSTPEEQKKLAARNGLEKAIKRREINALLPLTSHWYVEIRRRWKASIQTIFRQFCAYDRGGWTLAKSSVRCLLVRRKVHAFNMTKEGFGRRRKSRPVRRRGRGRRVEPIAT